MFYIPFAALVVLSLLFRSELGLKSLLVYWGIWIAGLGTALVLTLSPGYFIAFQSLLAVVMLIQLRLNPQL